MPWQEVTLMSQRKQFIKEAELRNTNFTDLCKIFEISTKTGYKWLKRYREKGINGLMNLSRRPHNIPNCTDSNTVKKVLSLRREYPRMGGRKIHHILRRDGIKNVPAASTITDILRRYGMPLRMTMDNGSPWGKKGNYELTRLTVWLIHLCIKVSHSSPYHPQTQGKDERFHRSLKEEWLNHRSIRNMKQAQQEFDKWIEFYNFKRPHEALEMKTSNEKYKHSDKVFPELMPVIEYPENDEVRKVQRNGEIHFHGRVFRISYALHGYHVAVRSTDKDGIYDVYYCKERVKSINFYENDLS
ncbi:integrase core domain-containing protein [bacterium]|nr:integrase core domain-containing protein [bacterium]